MSPALPELPSISYDSVIIHELKPGIEVFESQRQAKCSAEEGNLALRLLCDLQEDRSARCFIPGFRIELYQGPTMVFGASICWVCQNMRIDGALATRTGAAFDPTAEAARALLKLCQSVVAEAAPGDRQNL